MAAKVRRILAREKRMLPVRLTDAELIDRGRMIGALGFEIDSLESQVLGLKEQAKALAATSVVKTGELRQLAKVVRVGQEERLVPVQVEADMKTGQVIEVRMDTGEIIRERGMTSQEAQSVMDFGNPAAAAEAPKDVTPPKALKGKPAPEVEVVDPEPDDDGPEEEPE